VGDGDEEDLERIAEQVAEAYCQEETLQTLRRKNKQSNQLEWLRPWQALLLYVCMRNSRRIGVVRL
jgi:hypothetical protein